MTDSCHPQIQWKIFVNTSPIVSSTAAQTNAELKFRELEEEHGIRASVAWIAARNDKADVLETLGVLHHIGLGINEAPSMPACP
jgi:hypothetical protein